MKKFDKNYIKYHLLVDFFVMLAIVAYLVWGGMEEDGFNASVFTEMLITLGCLGLVAYALKTVYSFLYVKTSGYELKEREIVCKRGVFFKKTSVVEYQKMHAVNKKQNIIQKLFKIAILTVDSGATHNSNRAEIIIIENEKTVDSLILKLKALQSAKKLEVAETTEESKEEKENLFTFNSKKVLIYSALTILSSLAIILVLGTLTAISFAILKTALSKVFLISYKHFYLAFLMIAVSCVLLVSMLSFIISWLASFFSYYNFKVYKNQNDIEVNYGLLVRHTNTFKLSKIKGIKITQGIIKRLFGYATVNLEVIGYVHENSNQNGDKEYISGVLMPLCKVSEIKENLSKILPEYIPDDREIKATKYPPFVLWTIGFISMFTCLAYLLGLAVILTVKAYSIILSFTVVLFFAYVLIVAFVMVIELLSFKNSGLAINGDKITIYNGSIIKTCTVINAKNLIGVQDITTPLRKKAGIYTYVLHIRTNSLTNEIKVKNLPKEVGSQLQNLVKY